jgi:hypothetical protein
MTLTEGYTMSNNELFNSLERVPAWFKVTVGLAGILVSWKLFPILELLNLFALIVLVPMCLLGSGWLVAEGTSSLMLEVWNKTMDEARERAAA